MTETSIIALRTIDSLTELFTNFAKTGYVRKYFDAANFLNLPFFRFSHRFPNSNGKPAVDYKPIERNKIHYARIGNSGISVSLSPKNRSNQFWERILSNTTSV